MVFLIQHYYILIISLWLSIPDLLALSHRNKWLRTSGLGGSISPAYAVMDNLLLAMYYTKLKKAEKENQINQALSELRILPIKEQKVYSLSGGEQQRVALARVLLKPAHLVLCDEPTGNLDSKSSHIIMEELSDVHKKGNTIIMVTHNPDLVAYATRVITMFDGKIDTDTKNKKRVETENTIDRIEEVTEKLTEIKEELGV